jgi:iron complex outermembrane recepter protein
MECDTRKCLTGALTAGLAILNTAAFAQETSITLGPIDVSTRIRTRSAPGPASTTVTPSAPPSTETAAGGGTAFGIGITGTSTSVITAEEIGRSPSHSLQDILSREPGIQVTNLFGSVNGARSTVDMRGFGAAASNNTLILINGRRLNDLDLAAVDLAAIPRDSIERIEITRGNSGAVLYGDGAVGGVINIVTKSGVAQPPRLRAESAVGSFNYREGNVSAGGSSGPWSTSFYGIGIGSDGYRVNNAYRQLSAVGDIRYTYEQGSAYFNVTGDDQHLGLPGGRRVDPVAGLNQLVTDPRGATTPFDFADKQGWSVTAGITRMLAPGAELIVDGGVRQKNQKAAFFFATPTLATTDPLNAVDSVLSTSSITPRVKLNGIAGGMRWDATAGIDYYFADYGSDRSLFLGASPINRYDLTQSSLAGYWQQTVTVLPNTDLAAGARLQNTRVQARGTFNPDAPGGTSCFSGFCFPNGVAPIPLDHQETNYALHVGFEHRFNPNVAVFGRAARSFRVPNVDERIGVVTTGGIDPTNFDLRTQKSYDFEGGVRVHVGPFDLQTSVYDMYLTDEIHFRFLPGFEARNINLDPTRRYGSETMATYRASDRLRFKGGFAYTRAVFREGPQAGNDVPLVSRWTASGGVSWDVWPKWLTFDGIVRYVGERRMDNDQPNIQPLIPAHVLVDVRVGGEVDRMFWSFAVQNLFDVQYFDYAVASPFPFGFASQLNTYNAYPQPGRVFMGRLGLKLP